jgi:phage minor structural protein
MANTIIHIPTIIKKLYFGFDRYGNSGSTITNNDSGVVTTMYNDVLYFGTSRRLVAEFKDDVTNWTGTISYAIYKGSNKLSSGELMTVINGQRTQTGIYSYRFQSSGLTDYHVYFTATEMSMLSVSVPEQISQISFSNGRVYNSSSPSPVLFNSKITVSSITLPSSYSDEYGSIVAKQGEHPLGLVAEIKNGDVHISDYEIEYDGSDSSVEFYYGTKLIKFHEDGQLALIEAVSTDEYVLPEWTSSGKSLLGYSYNGNIYNPGDTIYINDVADITVVLIPNNDQDTDDGIVSPILFGPNGEPYATYIWKKYSYPKANPSSKLYVSTSQYPSLLSISYYGSYPHYYSGILTPMMFTSIQGTPYIADERIEELLNSVADKYISTSGNIYQFDQPLNWGRDSSGVYVMSKQLENAAGDYIEDVYAGAEMYPDNRNSGRYWYIKQSGGQNLFSGSGYGRMIDATEWHVEEELNGQYELNMVYPSSGPLFEHINRRAIIRAKVSPFDTKTQDFRIYDITKPINGLVEIRAHHISYDLSGVIVKGFTANNPSSAMAAITNNQVGSSGFTFTTTVSATKELAITAPTSVRAALGDGGASVLGCYGGEFEWDNKTVKHSLNRGQKRPVRIAYGVNMIDFQQEENIANCVTSVIGYVRQEGSFIYGNLIRADGFDYDNSIAVDFTSKWNSDTAPSASQIDTMTREYMSLESSNIGKPEISIEVSYAQLSKALNSIANPPSEYDALDVGDIITIYFEKLGIDAEAEVISKNYNGKLDRYDSIGVGDRAKNLSDTILAQSTILEKTVTNDFMVDAIANATRLITGNKGGNVVLHDSDNDDKPDEILIINTDKIEDATEVWRWNKSGLGYATGPNAYAGPYALAMTSDGHIVGSRIDVTGMTVGTANIADAAITNAKINTLDVNKLTVNGSSIGTNNRKTNDYVKTFYANDILVSAQQFPDGSYGTGTLTMSTLASGDVVMDANGITDRIHSTGKTYATWYDIINSTDRTSNAVFG